MNQKLLENFLKKKKRKKILVIGDTIIDQYYKVVVNRISPEFPIPILKSCEDKPFLEVPGGAANVAYSLKNFNVDVFYSSLLNQYAYNFLNKHINVLNIPSDYPCVSLKKRFYDNNFPICRWDVEDDYKKYDLKASRNHLFANLKYFLNEFSIDVVILSDYDKGLFDDELASDIIKLCNNENIITVVDPKNKIDRWKDCTVIKPNFKESIELSGVSEEFSKKEICDILQERLHCGTVVVTNSGLGFFGTNGKYFEFINDKTLKAESVIGGGDVFSGVFSLALSHGFNSEESAYIAFWAGATYVQKKYNEPIYPFELKENPKIVSLPELKQYRNNKNLKFVFTNGCFDLIHSGHIELLKFAKSKGDKLIVAVNSDSSVKRLKGVSRPIVSLRERMELLSGLDCVDFVINFDEDTPLDIIKEVKPDLIIKGGDYKSDQVVGSSLCEVVIFPYKKGFSTSKLLDKIIKIK